MLMQVHDLLPGLPPLSILTVIGASVMIATLVLYMLSRVPELLLITFIAGLYALVPVIGMMKHI
jgi:predicted PurR-regulated permease PerM